MFYIINLDDLAITDHETKEAADLFAAQLYYAGDDNLYLWDYGTATTIPYTESQLDELCETEANMISALAERVPNCQPHNSDRTSSEGRGASDE